MILGPIYRGPSILSKVLWTLSCSPWVLWALEMEQSVRTPLWEAKVISCADAGERINKSMRRKSICMPGGAFRAAENKTRTCPRAQHRRPESGANVNL